MSSSTNVTICRPLDEPAASSRSIFLAGSIKDDWQDKLISKLRERRLAESITIINPHRKDWDSSWKEDISDQKFREQVEWELKCQEKADIIAMYMHPETKAPISLLELGLSARSGKMVVCCPEGFWKRGNVQIVCKRYGIKMVEDVEDLVGEVIKKVEGLT